MAHAPRTGCLPVGVLLLSVCTIAPITEIRQKIHYAQRNAVGSTRQLSISQSLGRWQVNLRATDMSRRKFLLDDNAFDEICSEALWETQIRTATTQVAGSMLPLIEIFSPIVVVMHKLGATRKQIVAALSDAMVGSKANP